MGRAAGIRAFGACLAAAGVCAAAALGSGGAPAAGIVFSADRAPQLSGEIYRIDLNGRRVDLSRSPAMDTAPVVSPDGKRVAFFSNRGGRTAVYVVGTDGRDLVKVSPGLPASAEVFAGQQIAWSRDSRRLAVLLGQTTSHGTEESLLYVLESGRRPVLVRTAGYSGGPAWSPDGRLIAFSVSSIGVPSKTTEEIRAITPSGRLVWHVPGTFMFAWSARNRLAAEVGGRRVIRGLPYHTSSLHVYDERGRLRASAPDTQFAWTPDGSRLVTIDQRHRLEVRADGGTRLVLERKVPIGQIVWSGNRRLIADGFIVDLVRGTVGAMSSLGYASVVVSADGRNAATTVQHGQSFALRLEPTNGAEARTLLRAPGCANRNSLDDTITDLQFTPDGRSLVYQSDCPQPYSNLYMASPDTGAVRRLTWASELELDPQLSPDGKNIVFAQAVVCDSCQTGLWLANPDGSHRRQLVPAMSCGDGSPSWSADGTQIVFGVFGCDNPPYQLYTVRANGSRLRNLHVPGQEPAWGRRRLAYIGPDGSTIDTIAADGSHRRTVATGRANSLSLPAWSRDGRLAYLDQAGGRVTIVIRAGSSIRRIRLPFARVAGLAWSPDGHSFAVTGSANAVAPLDLYTIGADGHHLTRLTRNLNATGVSWQ